MTGVGAKDKDVLTYMQSLSAATGVPPPASLFAQPPPPDPYSTPVSGDKLYLCMIVIYLVSHAISSPLLETIGGIK
jgi:hypothetical protein